MMGIPTFSELSHRMYELYLAGKYAQAFDTATRAAQLYPENARQTQWWRTCLAARLGRLVLATEILRETLDAGLWYPVGMLRGDNDLDSLQGSTEFEDLVAICQRRQSAAERDARPLLLTFELAAQACPPQGYPLLIALHGNTGNAARHAPAWRGAADLGWFVAVPQSSQVYGPDAFVWNDRVRATEEITQHLRDLFAQHRIDPTQVVLGGMSKGAETAIFLVLTSAVDAQGFIAVAPARIQVPDLLPHAQQAATRGVTGSIVVGDKDHLYPMVCELAETLRSARVNCRLEVHPGLGHEYPSTFQESLASALLAFTVER